MSLQAQVTEIIAKLDKVATDAVEEKAEVLAALDALNGEVAIANGKVESANTEIASLKAEIIKLQEQIAAGETVDLAPLAAKVDTLEGLVEDIYVTPVVE
jgi:peptidoglycan hydrolase CwlO-like protein